MYSHAGAMFLGTVISIYLQADKSLSLLRCALALFISDDVSSKLLITEMMKPDLSLMQREADLSDVFDPKGPFYSELSLLSISSIVC